MKQITVTKNEAGQRLDKLLAKYLNKAPKSFLYKMLRKKNITLNGTKASGNEKIQLGDEIKLFLAEETIGKFSEILIEHTGQQLDILYEDEHILLVNKPCGMLSQKAERSDISLVEHVISYLMDTGAVTAEELQSFRPSICNRLDRNTSGIVAAGKSLAGLQEMAEIFKDRSIHKYYLCIVEGRMQETKLLEGYLRKDQRSNRVAISLQQETKDCQPIKTRYVPLAIGMDATLLEVELITGRSHQIRAHLASIGHPIVGDGKYGNPKRNEALRKELGLKHQLLHSYRMELPQLMGELAYLSGKVFYAPPSEIFQRIQKQKGLDTWQPGIQEG